MDTIKCTINYSPEDLQKAYMLHYKKFHPARRWLVPVLVAFIIIIGIFLLLVTHFGETHFFIAIFCVLYALLFGILYTWRIRTLGRRMFRKMFEFGKTYEYEFTEKSILAKAEGLISSDVNWEYYRHAIIDKNMIVLLPNKLKFNFYHKRHFTAEQFEQIKKWTMIKVTDLKFN